jgi:hypothetical protein
LTSEDFPSRRNSIVWEGDHFRSLDWSEFRREVETTPGGIGLAATDFQEMLEYHPAPLRDKTWVLRAAATELLAGATTEDDFRLLARICVILTAQGRYLDAAWLIVRIRTPQDQLDVSRAAGVLNALFLEGSSQLRHVLFGLSGFAESFEPAVATLDLLVSSGLLDPRVVATAERKGRTMKKVVFISYAREDAHEAKLIHDALTSAGFDPWMDQAGITAGDDWRLEIEKAQERADFGIICLSRRSIVKIGFFQVELRRLIERQEYHPKGRAFLIPVRLDSCSVPHELRHIHYLDLFPNQQAALASLVAALQAQGGKQGHSEELRSLRPDA